MTMIVHEPWTEAQIKAERAATGADRSDEVWDGVYVVSPFPNNEHGEIVSGLIFVFHTIINQPKLGRVYPGVNVSDRDTGWTHNYRGPDVVVFLNDTTAINRNTHWVGGPDFAVEILSEDDPAREKLDFYAKVGVREVLIVDRDPWALELYRLDRGALGMIGKVTLESDEGLRSEVLPLSFRLVSGAERPEIEATHSDGDRRWSI